MKEITYRFETKLFYEPESFQRVNKLFQSFGGEGKIGLSGGLGHIDLTLKAEEDAKPLPADILETMRKILEDKVQEATHDIEGAHITVKKAYILK